MLAFGVGTTLPILMVALLTRQGLLRRRKPMVNAARVGKVAMGVSALAVGTLILTGTNRNIEAALVSASPSWLTNLTTRF